jgi:hypothetical protein
MRCVPIAREKGRATGSRSAARSTFPRTVGVAADETLPKITSAMLAPR